MAKAFDATTKQLIEAHPADWLRFVGLPAGNSIAVVDADLSSFSLAADKVIRVGDPDPYIAHFEFQSGLDYGLDDRVLLYKVLLRWRHKLPVRSVVILLRPEAWSPAITGRVTETGWSENQLEFTYKLVRVWEQPTETFLNAGIGTLPLAAISAVPKERLHDVVRQMEERIEREAPADAAELETAAFILMGLRYPREMINQIIKGARKMKESVTYQAILEEGEAKGEAKGEARGEARGEVNGERAMLLHLAATRLGPPPPAILAALQAITDLHRLEAMADRFLLGVSSWEELLQA